jgi:hypothetical protein
MEEQRMKSTRLLASLLCLALVVLTVPLPAVAARRGGSGAPLQLIRVDPEGRNIVLTFRVPERLELQCSPMQLRVGDFSLQFREVRDYNARTASFVIGRDVYSAIDNRRFQTTLTACSNWITASVQYPPLSRPRPDRRYGY